jgi:hypothetical protein
LLAKIHHPKNLFKKINKIKTLAKTQMMKKGAITTTDL